MEAEDHTMSNLTKNYSNCSDIIGRVFLPLKYKGYFYNTKDGCLYSIKNRKNKPPKRMKLSRMYRQPTIVGWQISNAGKRIFISKDSVEKFMAKDVKPVSLIKTETHFEERLFEL